MDSSADDAARSEVASTASAKNWEWIALVPDAGREPRGDVSDRVAQGSWAAISCLWHPALLARAGALPRIEDVEAASPPMAGEVRVIAAGEGPRLPSGYRTGAADIGAVLVDGQLDRF